MAASPTRTALRTDRAFDYDLHGMVAIRLVGAGPGDRAAVDAQLGPIARPLTREPDIVVRFVHRLPTASPVRLVGLNDAAFTDDAFLILRGKHRMRVRVQFPFDSVGGQCEIVCERGVAAVPLLIAAINLTVLARGGLPMHASAVRYRGAGLLITGWSKGGKTETLLGLLGDGGEYVGDEWVYVDADGATMRGIPEPVRVWDWQLRQLPGYRRRVARSDRIRLEALRHATSALRRLQGNGQRPPPSWRLRIRQLVDLLEGQRYVHLPPGEAFGMSPGALEAPLDLVVFVLSHEAPEVTVERVPPEEVARRMAFSLQEERSALMSYYRRFRFGHPGRINPLIEAADEIEGARLLRALRGKPCYTLAHPYPPSIPALCEALRPWIGTAS